MQRVWISMLLVVMSVPALASLSSPASTPPTQASVAAEKATAAAKREAKEAKAEQKRNEKIQKFIAEGKDEVTFYTNDRMDFVKLVIMKTKEAKERAAQHPAVISLDKMKQYLGAVLVSEKDLLKKSPEVVKVFNDKAINFLSPILVKAFSQAKPDQMVVFSWLTKEPYVVLRNDRIVIGECWVTNNQLHIQFNKLLAKLIGDTDKRGNFNTVLDRSKGLRIHLLASTVLSPIGKQDLEAVIPLDGDFTTVGDVDSVAGGDDSNVTARRSMKDRLSDLDQLRKDKMITEVEYQNKRKALLNSL